MHDLKSRVAYLEGLSAGTNVNPDTNEGKLLSGIIEILKDFADTVDELEEAHEQLEDYLETIDEDLYHLEDQFYDANQDNDEYLEVDCPSCGEVVCFDADIIEDDDVIEVTCPTCDEVVFVNDDTYMHGEEPEFIEGRTLNTMDEDDI